MVRKGELEVAAGVEEYVGDESRDIANPFVEELVQLEAEYGVRLPALHDHVGERVVGALGSEPHGGVRFASLLRRGWTVTGRSEQ